jgi:hypothetical protein
VDHRVSGSVFVVATVRDMQLAPQLWVVWVLMSARASHTHGRGALQLRETHHNKLL